MTNEEIVKALHDLRDHIIDIEETLYRSAHTHEQGDSE
jgi:hypothetical protein